MRFQTEAFPLTKCTYERKQEGSWVSRILWNNIISHVYTLTICTQVTRHLLHSCGLSCTAPQEQCSWAFHTRSSSARHQTQSLWPNQSHLKENKWAWIEQTVSLKKPNSCSSSTRKCWEHIWVCLFHVTLSQYLSWLPYHRWGRCSPVSGLCGWPCWCAGSGPPSAAWSYSSEPPVLWPPSCACAAPAGTERTAALMRGGTQNKLDQMAQ